MQSEAAGCEECNACTRRRRANSVQQRPLSNQRLQLSGSYLAVNNEVGPDHLLALSHYPSSSWHKLHNHCKTHAMPKMSSMLRTGHKSGLAESAPCPRTRARGGHSRTGAIQSSAHCGTDTRKPCRASAACRFEGAPLMTDHPSPSSPGTPGASPHASDPSASARIRCTCQSSRASGGVSRNETRSLRCAISGVMLHASPIDDTVLDKTPPSPSLLRLRRIGPAMGLACASDPGVADRSSASPPS